MEETNEKDTGEQPLSRHDILENEKKGKADHLQPYQYKKGQSGNPAGRAKGISLKEYAKVKLLHMTDEEREDFFNGLPKDKIWEMAEGKAEAKTDITSKGEKIEGNTIILQDFKDETNSK